MEGLLKGIQTPNNGPVISHLFYADDALVLGEWDRVNVKNVARCLRIFYLCSGLRINLLKSNLYGLGVDSGSVSDLAKVIGCKSDSTPLTYLGIKVGSNMNRINNWANIIEIFDKRLSLWRAKTLSMGGRLTLINSVLESLPIYYLSLYKAPVGVLKVLEAKMRKFLWAGSGNTSKMNWVAWDWITWPKTKGGLGISRLKEVNEALLVKWGWRYRSENHNMWCKLVEACHCKYNQRGFLPINSNISGCWKNIVNLISKVKINGKGLNHLIKGKVGNGVDIRFWIDTWVGDLPFWERWPRLFGLEMFKLCRVSERLDNGRGNGVLNWQWSRQPESEEELEEWKECCEVTSMVSLSIGKDAWLWNGDSQNGFSVKAVKSALISDRGSGHPPNFNWCKWVPIKCNIMNWRGNLDRLPSRVNLRRRNVDIPSTVCPLCEETEESVEHLFTACSIALRVWAAFSDWCKIPPLFLFEFKDILDIHKFIKCSKKEEKIIYGLALITSWCIWKERNEVVFNQKRCNPLDIIGELKSRSFAWVKNRSSCKDIRWKEWCKYPMYML
ncbi:putative RNA-directed DNA polymerase [Helianthus annuus]|nr:putative RNA-directed DNA polymerase [Helianthus annuus]